LRIIAISSQERRARAKPFPLLQGPDAFARIVPRRDHRKSRDLHRRAGMTAQSLRDARGGSCKDVRCALSVAIAMDDAPSHLPVTPALSRPARFREPLDARPSPPIITVPDIHTVSRIR
jgi:hypothetical protein